MPERTRLSETAIFPAEPDELMCAAAAAGRWSATRFALICSAAQPGLAGTALIHLEPADGPIAVLLHRQGLGHISTPPRVMIVPIVLSAADLGGIAGAARMARVLLVRHAYAAAYSTVLARQAGVRTEIRLATDSADRNALIPPRDTRADARTEAADPPPDKVPSPIAYS